MPWYGSHRYLNDHIRRSHSRRIMEIGVYNAENAYTMIQAAMENTPPSQVEYYGFDYFTSYTDQQIEKKLRETGAKITLIPGDTMDTLPEAAETLPEMDLIFIDAGKTEQEATSDWTHASRLMHNTTAVYIHNADFPGVHRTVQKIPRDLYQVELFREKWSGQVAHVKKRPTGPASQASG